MIPQVKTCCCCISLSAAAHMIGIYLFIQNCITIFLAKFQPADEDNETERNILEIYEELHVVFTIVLAFAGLCIFIAAWKKLRIILKFAALCVLASSICMYIIAWLCIIGDGDEIMYSKYRIEIIFDTMFFGIHLYFFVVSWSLCNEMLKREEPQVENVEESS